MPAFLSGPTFAATHRTAGRLQVAAVNDARDVVVAMAAITTAVNDGRLTVEEAGQFVHILNCYSKAIEVYDHSTRIAAIESQIKKRP